MPIMTEYARQREARRRYRLIPLVGFVIPMGVRLSLGASWVPISLVFAFLAALLATSYVRLRQQTRALRRPPQHVTLPMSWSSTAPLWVARAHPESSVETGEVFGRLTCAPTGWTWEPTPRSRRKGAVTFQWPNAPDLDVSFSPIWGPIPMCRVTLSVGARSLDFWVRGRAVDIRDALATNQQRV
jgi:hypothetical protein